MDQLSFEDVPAEGEPEIWKPVVGFEGLYEVSSLGRIKSLPRPRVRQARMLTPYKWKSPRAEYYVLYVGLSDRDGKQKNYKVASLVAAAFIGLKPAGQVVRHGPNGSLDDRASQLSYGSRWENNVPDKLRDGTMLFGEDHQNSKLTMEIVGECRRRAVAGETQRALAVEFGVQPTTMGNAIMGKTWVACPVPPFRIGRRRGANHYGAKLTAEMVIEARQRHAQGESINSLTKVYGVTWNALRDAITGKGWRDVPMPDSA